jgi:putative MATE family efflux protein
MQIKEKLLLKNRKDEFYSLLFKLAIPVAMQSFISTSLNIIDSIMVGKLREDALAAVGAANQYFYVFILLIFGIASGISIFTAQYWGQKNISEIKKTMAIGVVSTVIASMFFAILAWIIPKSIIGVFVKTNGIGNALVLGEKYLKIVAFSYVITSLSLVYSAASRSIERTKEIMWASSISLACNTFLNYLLIEGHFGAPALGVKGAAIATVIARCVEFLLIMKYVYGKKLPLALRLNEFLGFTINDIKRIYSKVVFVILNESLWALGISLYAVAYGYIGTSAVAAIQVCNSIQNLFMIVAKSLSTASGTMIGNKIGEKNGVLAHLYAKRFLKLGIVFGFLSAVLLRLITPWIASWYEVSSATRMDIISTLNIIGLFLVFKILNVIMTVGILRSGGETKFAFAVDVGTVWFIGVPLAFLGSIYLKLSLHEVVAMLSVEEILKCIVCWLKIRKNDWNQNLVDVA